MAFPDDPLECRLELLIDGVWVDVTGDLVDQRVSISRGRSDESSDPSPASMSFELDNPSGDWTPDRAQSPWRPHIRRGVRCRFSVHWDGGWHVRFFGDAASWEPDWPAGDNATVSQPAEARVSVTASGVLRRLTQGQKALQSPLRRRVMSAQRLPNVVAYWPLENGDQSAGVSPSPLPGVPPIVFGGEYNFASDDTLPGSGSVVNIPADQPFGFSGEIPQANSSLWRLDFFYQLFEPPTTGHFSLMQVTSTGTTARWVFDISAFNDLNIRGFNSAGTQQFINTIASPSNFGQWIGVSLRVRQEGTRVFRFLQAGPVGETPPSASGSTNSHRIGRPRHVRNLADAPPGGYSFGHIVVSTNPFFWLLGADVGHQGEPAAVRVDRLCGEENVPVEIVGDASASEQMGVQGSEALVELLLEATRAEAGVISEPLDAAGFRFRTRETRANQVPALDLDASTRPVAGRPASDITHPLGPVLDDQRLRNEVIVERPTGSSVQVSDHSSIEAEGLYDTKEERNVATDRQMAQHAGWLLALGTWPEMRLPALTPDLNIAAHLIPAWLDTDLGDRATVVNLPSQYPESGIDVHIEAWTETISPSRWDVTLTCSPAGPWQVGVLDDDQDPPPNLDLDRLDTDGSELVAAVDETETGTWGVQVTEGPPWTTDPDYFPLDILLGGERVTVSGITGGGAGVDAVHGQGDGDADSASTSHVAPSVDAAGAADLLVCAWMSWSETGTYTVPGSMTAGAATSGFWGTMQSATQTLAASGATGTRTGTFSVSDQWGAVAVIAHRSTAGSPVIEEALSDVATGQPAADITLTTDASTEEGWWLLAIHGWVQDTAGTMGAPSGDGWEPVADSAVLGPAARIRAWARRVEEPGAQVVTFVGSGETSDDDDQHARLLVLSGVTSAIQSFTVAARSVNDVTKAHPAGTAVNVADPFRLTL